MTKEEVEVLQLEYQRSGKSLKSYLQQRGTSYSTWHYWRKKYGAETVPEAIVPVTFSNPPVQDGQLSSTMPDGTTLLFPNGLRAHFGGGSERVLMEILTKSLSDYVLP